MRWAFTSRRSTAAFFLRPRDRLLQTDRGGQTDNAKNAAEGKAAPELKATNWLNTAGDKPLTWKEMRGKVVLIDLWAFW